MSDPHPYRGVVEIRIHGVSGTPPEDLLDRSPVRQVAGDQIGGFYRPVLAERMRDRPNGASPDHGPWLEGYSWGGWTSGARSRALWLALLPFALVNVAPRMLPPWRGGSGARLGDTSAGGGTSARESGVGAGHRFIGAVMRLLALSLTVIYTFGFADVAFATVARRCGLNPALTPPGAEPVVCEGLPTWLVAFLQRLTGPWQLGLSAVIPLGAVGLMWGLSTLSSQRYENIDPEADVDTPVLPEDDRMPLGRRDLWRGSRRVRRLRMVHVHAGFVTTAGMLAYVFPDSGLRTTTLVLAGLTLAFSCGTAIWRPANNSPLISRRARLNWITLALTYLAVLVLLITGQVNETTDLVANTMILNLDHLYLWLFKVQLVLLISAFVVLLATRPWRSVPGGVADRGAKPPRIRLCGFGTMVFALLGWLVGLMFTAALVILAPTWLYTKGFVVGPSVIAEFIRAHRAWFGSSVLSSGFGMLVGLGLIVLLIIGFVVCVTIRLATGGTRQDKTAVAVSYGKPNPCDQPWLQRWFDGLKRYWNEENPRAAADVERNDPSDPTLGEAGRRRLKSIAFMFWIARRVDYAPIALAVLCAGMSTFLIVQILAYLGWGWRVLAIKDADTLTESGFARTAVAWGAYFIVAALIGALILGVASYRLRSTRKGVGVLWDLTCFWPRDVHPFAPPCYTERIVPEVSRRLRAYLTKPVPSPDATATEPAPAAAVTEPAAAATEPAIVLAAHSQGTVIGMAVLLAQPPDFDLARVGLLTFGTVLDRLYARFFPRYFTAEAFSSLATTLTGPPGLRWINLWRYSDYLGGSLPYPPGPPFPPRTPEPQGEDRRGPENVRATDPLFDIPADGITYPPAGRHSNYWRDPEFQEQIGVLIRRLGHVPADAIPELPPTPPFPEAPPSIR